MTQATGEARLHTTPEFDRWWESRCRDADFLSTLDPASARRVAWEAWKKGREQLSEAMAHLRLQPSRR
jgi:hypothetical protein